MAVEALQVGRQQHRRVGPGIERAREHHAVGEHGAPDDRDAEVRIEVRLPVADQQHLAGAAAAGLRQPARCQADGRRRILTAASRNTPPRRPTARAA